MDYIDACQNGRWSVETWPKDGTGPGTVRPFKCHSWRHEGECREWCDDCDFSRILAAVKSRQNWTVNVLTYPHAKWPNTSDLFKFGVVSWSRLRKRLQRKFGKIEYIQTWEIHKSGYPHVNIAISNHSLYLLAESDFFRTKRDILDPMGKEVGFGHWTWFEALKSPEGYSGYILKKAAELTGANAKDQTPINAPRHFRRLRASQKLLPPRFRDDTITGRLHQLSAAKVADNFGAELRKEPAECSKPKSV